MSRVFISAGTGAAIIVFAEDHCPPHVHARHRGEGWIVRARFSFADNGVALLSIAPTGNIPARRAVGRLLDEIAARLPACRLHWWTVNRTVCLTNQWATVPVAGTPVLVAPRTPRARQIVDAGYDPESRRLRATFLDGTVIDREILP